MAQRPGATALMPNIPVNQDEAGGVGVVDRRQFPVVFVDRRESGAARSAGGQSKGEDERPALV